MANGNVEMMVSVLPGTMTGFAALNAGLASINNSFLNMTQAISDNFGLVETAVVTTGVVIGQVAADAASSFGDFEQSMKIVQMVSGQAAQDISYLGQKANEFAVQYRVDIDSITEGLQTLGRAGLNTASEQSEVLQNGLNTAKLEGRELNSVLEELIQNTALLGGDLKTSEFGEQSEYINNLLVATSLSAPITTHDVSETLKYSGGIAAAAGANIESSQGKEILEDYMGTIAAFAQKGVTGSIAGTALRAFLNKPATQDSSVLEGLATIKLKPEYLWEDSGDVMKPISEQIYIIQKQMEKLEIPTMDRLQIWSKIVGGKMGQQMMKLDSSDIKNLTRDIQDAQSAENLATKSMQTYNANINQMQQRGQALFREFGEKIVFFVNPILDTINKIMDAFDKLFGGFGMDVASSALFVGLLAFMRKFVSLVRQVISGLRHGLSNIWSDYRSGNKFTIRDYRGDKGKTIIGRDGKEYKVVPTGGQKFDDTYLRTSSSPKDFLNKWGASQAWKDFQEGKISANQYGVIAKTANWNARQIFPKDIFPAIKQSDKQIMETLSRGGYLKNHHISAIQEMSGKQGKSQFLSKYKKDMQDLYLQYLKDTQATKQNANAHVEASKSAAKNTAAQKEAAVAEENKNREIVTDTKTAANTIVTETKTTTSTIVSEWNAMCANLVQNITAVQTKTKPKQSPVTPTYPGTAMINNQKPVFYPDKSTPLIYPERTSDKQWSLSDVDKNKVKDDLVTPTSSIGKKHAMPDPVMGARPTPADARIAVEERILILAKQREDAERRRSTHVGSKGFVSQSEAPRFREDATEEAKKSRAINRTRNYINDSSKLNSISGNPPVKSTITSYEDYYRKNFNKDGEHISTLKDNTKALNDLHKGKYPETISKENKELINFYKNQGNQEYTTKELTAALDKHYQKQADASKNLPLRQRLSNWINGTLVGSQTKSQTSLPGGTFLSNASAFLTRSREGRLLGFANKGLGKVGNAALNLSDAIGGPVMIAFMGLQLIISAVQKAFQEFCAELKDAEQAVDNAYKKVEEANNDLETTYKENNPNATQEDIDTFMGDIYSQMEQDMQNQHGEFADKASRGISYQEYEYDSEADDGSMKEKEKEELTYEDAVKQNTAALYAATAELRMVTDRLITKMNDKIWGIDGTSSEISDSWGKFADTWGGLVDGSQFSDEGTFLKTASQKDDNYAGYTELSGLMLEDLHDAKGEWEKGFETLFGSQDGKNIASAMSKPAQSMMKSFGRFANDLSRADNSRLQTSMKRSKKDWQALAKEVAKYQRKTGKLPGKDKTDNKRLEKLISKLATETGLNRLQILQAQSLQAMQDMYEIAQTAIVPTISTEADIAASHYQLANTGINPASQQASYGAQDTASIAASIASMVAMIAQTKAAEAAWQNGILAGDPDALAANSAEDYLKKGVGQTISFGTTFHKPEGMSEADWGWSQYGIQDGKFYGWKTRIGGNDKILDNIYTTFEMMGEMRRHPDWNEDQAYDKAVEKLAPYKDGDRYAYNPDVMLKMLRENYADAVAPAILDAYMASGLGEDSGNSGGGSGSGGGSDNDDDDKKTKKERVDLVLCNKKEIPKLNVNLFKKAPSFTILNKNFKLRDIKVNTQDKPKAVLASIKNAIIDVQKRSDPKIIQDESAEYDPVSATEGSSVPSGSTNTSTD